MIGKGKSIAHTHASIAYGMKQEKQSEIVFKQHLAGETPREVTQEFRLVQLQNKRCSKNTLSFVLSPTIEDGKRLHRKELKEIVQRFMNQMILQDRQAIAFVHRNREHTHIHLYVNRIDFQGHAYKDNYIGKRSQQAAERAAREMGLTTVREAQEQKLNKVKETRVFIKRIHEKVIKEVRPEDFDLYIRAMKAYSIKVTPSINKQNQLQGFRFAFAGENLKGSEVHRSMSMGGIAQQLGFNRNVIDKAKTENTMSVLGKIVNLSPKLVAKIATKVVRKTFKKTIDQGIGIEIEM
jgi:hypothetical protein